ncbi:MAG: Phosphoglycolate phosphatase [Syntrophorhabdus sp. PtaU1.Bin002]|nr:MAG: Phosphoglycolate phosphatase [Syntrophorhabdus sp. PtaB.Bin006]OPY73191.1 MAG: Phosphoglycolate phosphatase [Syntrophorhabdus sp. PtaU1.Bin002]
MIDVKALIFDIDGTLVDSFDAYREVFNQGVAEFDVGPISRDVLRDYLAKGLSLREILQNVFVSPMDDAAYEVCRAKILQLFKQVEQEGVKPFTGTEALFRYLEAKGIKIGIATGRTSSPEDEWLRFRRLGLDRYISTIVTSREVEHRKPAPDAIIECSRRLNIPLEQCVIVGDTESDIVAAKRAGAIAVAVTTGQENGDVLLKAEPAVVLKDLGNLIAYLEEQKPFHALSEARQKEE